MQRLARLDGLRGVLAVYVMLGHAMPFTALPGWVQGPLHHGEAAVDLFFCLSGLVVVNSLERFGHRAAPFFAARAWRLLPVYWCVLAFAVALMFLGSPLPDMGWVAPGSMAASFWALQPPKEFVWDLALHVSLLHGLVPQGVLPWGFLALLGPAWSLSTEWQFYAVMAAFLRRGRLAGFAYAMAALAVIYHAAAPFFLPYWTFSRAFLPDAAGYFALGLASAAWLRGEGWRPLAVIFAVVSVLGFCSAEPSKGLIGAGWLLALGAQRFDSMPALPRLLESRVAQFLGAVSYPLYLLNEPVQRAAAMLLAPAAHGDAVLFTWLWLPVALAGPVAAAAVMHRWVERPFMRGVKIRKKKKEVTFFEKKVTKKTFDSPGL